MAGRGEFSPDVCIDYQEMDRAKYRPRRRVPMGGKQPSLLDAPCGAVLECFVPISASFAIINIVSKQTLMTSRLFSTQDFAALDAWLLCWTHGSNQCTTPGFGVSLETNSKTFVCAFDNPRLLWAGVFEQYSAHKGRIPVEMIMPDEQRASLRAHVEAGKTEEVRESLTQVDVQNAKASHAEDEAKVKQVIQDSVGYNAVNEAVKKSMRHMLGEAAFSQGAAPEAAAQQHAAKEDKAAAVQQELDGKAAQEKQAVEDQLAASEAAASEARAHVLELEQQLAAKDRDAAAAQQELDGKAELFVPKASPISQHEATVEATPANSCCCRVM